MPKDDDRVSDGRLRELAYGSRAMLKDVPDFRATARELLQHRSQPVRRCQREGCEQPAWLCSGHSNEWADVELLRELEGVQCNLQCGGICGDETHDPAHYCAPCLARRALRAPTNPDGTRPDEPPDRGYVGEGVDTPSDKWLHDYVRGFDEAQNRALAILDADREAWAGGDAMMTYGAEALGEATESIAKLRPHGAIDYGDGPETNEDITEAVEGAHDHEAREQLDELAACLGRLEMRVASMDESGGKRLDALEDAMDNLQDWR